MSLQQINHIPSAMARFLSLGRRVLLGLALLSTSVLIMNLRGVSEYLKPRVQSEDGVIEHTIIIQRNILNGTASDKYRDPGYVALRQPRVYLNEEFRARQEHLQQMCLQGGLEPPDNLATSKFSSGSIVQVKHAIVYCPVQKVASSFWTKTIAAINSRGMYNSPYLLHPASKYKPISYQGLKRKDSLYSTFLSHLDKGVSLIVVRDPYTKLFSAYADKFYKPNWLYWATEGKEIQKIIGNKVESPEKPLCGNDVSFSDFIRYIIRQYENNMKMDKHFTTITEHCHPCHTKYDYISKFETFKNDTMLILEDWKMRFGITIQFNDFDKETAYEIARKHVRLGFATMEKYAEMCKIPYGNFYVRIWRFLQISGILPKDSQMPFSHEDKISSSEYFGVVANVLARNYTWDKVKTQRREALEQAYNTVDRQHMFKLRDIVRPDCTYFQYNDQPQSLFRKHTAKYDIDFKYFPGLGSPIDYDEL